MTFKAVMKRETSMFNALHTMFIQSGSLFMEDVCRIRKQSPR